MIRSEDRAIASSDDGHPSDELTRAISERSPASLRDESIWQYHLHGCRGLIRWNADHSFRYFPVDEFDCCKELSGIEPNEIKVLLAAYEPTKEAVLVNELPDGRELLRIEQNGDLTLLRIESLTLGARN